MEQPELKVKSPEEEISQKEIDAIDKIDDISEDKNIRKKFLQNQYVMATYKTHLDKKILESFFRSKVDDIKFWRAAHENADKKDPYPHTHVLVDFGKSFTTRDSRFFDVENENGVIHPNFKPIKTRIHWRNALNYIAKEDPENKDLKKKVPIACKVWDKPTLTEALEEFVNKPSDAMGIIALYNSRPSSMELKSISDSFAGWQTEFMMELMGNGGDRKIIWIFDPVGGCGKTKFGRSLMIDDPKKFFYTTEVHTLRDMATVIESGIESGWNGHCFFLNLTRAAETHKIYNSMEAVRDGALTTQKYKGKTLLFEIDFLVTFANWLPEFSALTMDRWDVRIVLGAGENGDLDRSYLRRLNIKEAAGIKEYLDKHEASERQAAAKRVTKTYEAWDAKQNIQ